MLPSMTMLAAGQCRICRVPLPARPDVVGAAYCKTCRDAKVKELEASTRIATVRARALGKAWLDGENITKPPEVRDGIRSGGKPMAGLLKAFQPRERKCQGCGAVYVGMSAWCSPCASAALAEQERLEAGRFEQVRMARERDRLLWANLPLPDPKTGAVRTWETLQPRKDVPELVHAVTHARRWVAGEGAPWLVLVGGNGLGKSHVAEAALRELAAAGKQVRWESVVGLLKRLRQCYDRGESADDLLDRVIGTPWLVLDDLGRESPEDGRGRTASAWVQAQLFRLVDERGIARRPTLVSTNEGLKTLAARLGQATAERVMDTGTGLTAMVTLEGKSWRLR
mgnify:CR=1 FL=1